MKHALMMMIFFIFSQVMAQEKMVYNHTTNDIFGNPISDIGLSPESLHVFDGKLYFTAKTEEFGRELWVYEGYGEPQMVEDIVMGDKSSSPQCLITFKGALYFSILTADRKHELWKYNGLDLPEKIADIDSDTGMFVNLSRPWDFTVFNDKLLYRTTTGIWEFDGTNPPVRITESHAFNSVNSTPKMIAYQGKLYLALKPNKGSFENEELWVYDGVNPPTLFADINLTNYADKSSSPSNFYIYNNKLYFGAFNGNQNTLYEMNGHTQPVEISLPTSVRTPQEFVTFNDKMYFTVSNATTADTELWIYDGNSNPTLFWESNFATGATQLYLTVVDNILYFNGFKSHSDWYQVWQYDGNTSPTPLTAIAQGQGHCTPSSLTAFKNKLYFTADDVVNGRELWVYGETDEVCIINPTFAQYLIDDGHDTNNDGLIQCTEAQAITELNLNGKWSKNITTLEGLEKLTNLEILKGKYFDVADVDLTSNTKLKHLSIATSTSSSTRGIDNLNVSACPDLEYLYISGDLTSLDLSNNPKMEHLYCAYNQIETLNIENCTNLKFLDCTENNLTSFDVSKNVNLETLYCRNNDLSNFSFDISNNINLKVLKAGKCNLSSLDLSTNLLLEELSCSDNQLSGLDLTGLSQLKYLDCGKNQISSLNFGNEHTAMERLYCNDNGMTTLDIIKCINLKALGASDNHLSSIDVQSNTKLETLRMTNNPLLTLDLSKNIQLQTFDVSRCKLTSLDITKNSLLTEIRISGNAITEIDLSQNPELIYLTAENTALSGLSIAKNFKIEQLELGNGNAFDKICVGDESKYVLHQIPIFRIAYSDFTFEVCEEEEQKEGHSITVNNAKNVNVGDVIEVTINTSEILKDENLISYQLKFGFDNTKFQYVGNDLTTFTQGGYITINEDTQNSLLDISYINASMLNGSGNILTLKFKALTLGDASFSITDFKYNETLVTDITNSSVTIVNPTTVQLTLSDADKAVKAGEKLVITATYSEAIKDTPVPQISLDGAVTLTATNMTKISETVYTYTYIVENGDGEVTVTLSEATDIYGNAVATADTETFTIIPIMYGDVSGNGEVTAYDAALALQYSVGLDPLPSIDPLPWEPWRIIAADVDGVKGVSANDVSEILKFSAKIITKFPVEGGQSGGRLSYGEIYIIQEENQLAFYATGDVYNLNLSTTSFEKLGEPIVQDANMMTAQNMTNTSYKFGLATTYALQKDKAFLTIPLKGTLTENINFDIIVNSVPQTISTSDKASELSFYPNPVSDILQIRGLENGESLKASIYNVSGKLMKEVMINGGKVDFSGMNRGVYYIMFDDTKQKTKLIIKD